MLALSIPGWSQQIEARNKTLESVLTQVQEQTAYRLFWVPEEIAGIRVNIQEDTKDIRKFLSKALEGTDLKFTIFNDRYIHILKDRLMVADMPAFAPYHAGGNKQGSYAAGEIFTDSRKADSENKVYIIGDSQNASSQEMVELRGIITSFKTGEPMMGVNMVVKKPTWSAAVSDADGKFGDFKPNGGQIVDVILEVVVNDGIENVVTNENSVIYDLTGRKIEKISGKGIYIVNGKKVMVK